MSFQGKAFWMAKDTGCLNNGEVAYDNSSRIEPKRAHQWLLDATEPEMFSNKKQALEIQNNRSFSGVPNGNLSPWENPPSFQSVQSQYTDQLFGSEPARNINFNGRNIPPIGTGNLNLGRSIEEQFGNDASVALSMSPMMDDPGSCLNYGGIRKVKINQVKDSESSLSVLMGHTLNKNNHNSLFFNQAEPSCSMMGHTFKKGDNNTISFNQVKDTDSGITVSMGHSFSMGDDSMSFKQVNDSNSCMPASMGQSFNKGNSNTISFSGFHEEPETNPSGRLISHYDLLMSQSSVQPSEALNGEELVNSNADVIVSTSQMATMGSDTIPKNKMDLKVSKKVPPNNFPSNVRSLLSTGILDGVPVKYISWSREGLCGVIKGSGYLCSCQLCNNSKVLNAYEFERHAGCKTKHPNNHIFFENGKTIYAIVQELRSTPQNLLFEAIQTVTGSPINQKSFRIWKESFQAATRELQRIFGKDEKNQISQVGRYLGRTEKPTGTPHKRKRTSISSRRV